MKLRFTIIVGFFLLLVLKGNSQVNQQEFLKNFNKADFKEKVRLVSSVGYAEIKEIYPLIEDTLNKIKQKVYNNTTSSEAKFLFEKIEASKAVYFNQLAKGVFILENALNNHARDIHDSLYCLNTLKHVYIKINNLNKAIEANELFDKLAKRSGEEKYLAQKMKKSAICNAFGLMNQAILEKQKEFNEEYLKRKNDTDFIAGYHNDMAVYYNKQKNSDSAIFHLDIAERYITAKLKYTKNLEFYQFFKGLIQGNKALAYTNNGDYKSAIPLLKIDIYYSLKHNNTESALNSYVLISQCYIKLKDFRNAVLYTDSAKMFAQKSDQIRQKLNYILLDADLLYALGKFDLAANKFREYILYKDSVNNHDKEVQLINQQVALDIQTKDIELAEKNALIQNSKVGEAKQKAFRAYLMAGIVILVLLIGILFYNNNLSKKREYELSVRNNQIQSQNKLIENSLREKELLLREIHHRVKNNLQIISSIINIQNEKSKDVKTKEILDELKLRISSIALTHQMLYQKGSMSEVLLNEYIQNLIKQINTSYDNQTVKIETDYVSPDIKLNIDLAIPLGLLVNEIITNSFKHAFKGKENGTIHVKVAVMGNEIKISVKDNGIGLPKNYAQLLEEKQSLGFELIAILTEQINARLEINNNNGTEIGISFKA